jgi:hypothetical protein
MAIYRGLGGSGESTNDAATQLLAQYTFDAEAAKIAAQASQAAAEAAKVIAVDASESALADSITAGNAADEASESAAEAAASAEAAATFDPAGFVSKTGATGSAVIPAGSEAQRNGSPVAGNFRFNTDTNQFEGYNGTAWGAIGGGGSGGLESTFMLMGS